MLIEQSSARPRFAREDPANFIPPDPVLPVKARKLADRCHNPLTWAASSADRLYQGPTVVIYPTLLLRIAAQEHADSIYRAAVRNQAGGLHYI